MIAGGDPPRAAFDGLDLPGANAASAAFSEERLQALSK